MEGCQSGRMCTLGKRVNESSAGSNPASSAINFAKSDYVKIVRFFTFQNKNEKKFYTSYV